MKQTGINADTDFSVYQKVAMGSLFQRDAGAEMRRGFPGLTVSCMPPATFNLYSPMHVNISCGSNFQIFGAII